VRRVHAVGVATVPYPTTGPVVDPQMLLVIATACRDHERLRFRYRSHDGELSRRVVEPQGLVHTGRRWYLVAWDTARSDWRTFRVDRIEAQPRTDRRFLPREPPGDLADWVARGVSAARDSYQARVILHAPVATVAARVPYGAGTVEEIDERRCLLRTGADWLDGLAIYIANIGVEFEIVEPPELIDRVRDLAQRFERAAERRDGAARPGASAC
jgi:predicted DNA-binding transcriptional regulator YafY